MRRTTFFALAGVLLFRAAPAQVPPVQGNPVDAFTLRYIDVVTGAGAPAEAGKLYVVHYTGYLKDGTKFDSSVDRQQPFRFRQGKRQVIAGWDAGFAGMRVGGKRRLLIPYQLAYGDKGNGRIPGKADLIFDVELLDVQEGPATPQNVDIVDPLKQSREEVLALARAVPEEKYGWRPSPGVRSFGEVFLHIANGIDLLLGMQAEPSKEALEKQVADSLATEKQALTKARVLERLTESFTKAQAEMEKARGLETELAFFGQPNNRRGIYVAIDTHTAEHLGQAIAYARVNGIVPPWSR